MTISQLTQNFFDDIPHCGLDGDKTAHHKRTKDLINAVKRIPGQSA